MSNWNASNYRQRKALRLAQVKPEWIINPETGEQFYLRQVGGMLGSIMAGYMPGSLTKIAVEAWREKGVEGTLPSAEEIAATLTPEQISDAADETETLSRIAQDSCVIPLLSNQSPNRMTFSNEWKAAAIAGLKEKDPHFDEAAFDPKDYVLNPKELDDKDANWLLKWAAGVAGAVSLKGGNVVSAGNFSGSRKKLARGSRARADKSAVLKTA